MARHVHCVRPRGLVDADRGRRRAVEAAVTVLRLCAHFHPRGILDPDHRAIGIGAQNDGGEFLRLGEPPLRLDIDLDLLLGRDRRRADAAQRRLNVLALDGSDDVVRRQIELGQPIRVEPDAQGIVERPEQRCLPDAFDARQWIDDVDRRVIAQVNGIVGAVRRIEVDHLQQRGGFLADGEAVARDLRRQLRDGEAGAVLHVNGVDVGIRAQPEGHRQDVATVRGAGGLIIERVVDAVDLLLDRLRHSVTCGGTMSGNCAMGIAKIAMTPARVMTMAMTMASRGRSMKMPDNICLQHAHLCWMRDQPAHAVCSPPPCGEGFGVGVVVVARLASANSDPHPGASP